MRIASISRFVIAGLFVVASVGMGAPGQAQAENGDTFAVETQPVSMVGVLAKNRIWLLVTFPDANAIRVIDDKGQVAAEHSEVNEPLGIGLGPKEVYVGSGKDGRVDVFGIKGKKFTGWQGTLGVGGGEFQRPVAIAVSPLTGRIYVADVKRGDVRIYDPETLQQVGSVGEGTLTSPCGLVFDSLGQLFVSDMMEGEVYKFLPDGTFGGRFTRQGDDPGETVRPIGLAVDDQDRVYVVDAYFGRVQLYSPSGQWIRNIGAIGQGPGLMQTPLDVAVHPKQPRIYITDTTDHEVESYALIEGQ